jgi:hypothetical protein
MYNSKEEALNKLLVNLDDIDYELKERDLYFLIDAAYSAMTETELIMRIVSRALGKNLERRGNLTI